MEELYHMANEPLACAGCGEIAGPDHLCNENPGEEDEPEVQKAQAQSEEKGLEGFREALTGPEQGAKTGPQGRQNTGTREKLDAIDALDD